MISDHRCFFCFTRAFEKLLEKENISNEAKKSFTYDLIRLYKNNWDYFIAPEFARELHCILRSYTFNQDPYKQEKKENNDQALKLYPDLQEIIRHSGDPFSAALRFAIAGNIIDLAANENFNLQLTIDGALNTVFAIDHSERLRDALSKAETILYLGDNAGEIVFDKLFIETINHPGLVYVVRGAPIINDATMEDAEYIGMDDVARVISSEYDAPSTVLHKSGNSLQTIFKEADLIISKGQGNLEGLVELNDDRLFFLLMVKCDVIAEFLQVRKESFVVYNAHA